MKLCIFGAGSIGAYLGVELARGGIDVSLVARGPHLQAMKKNGVTLRVGDAEHTEHPRCTDDPAELGPQDFVIVTLKAHSVAGVCDAMRSPFFNFLSTAKPPEAPLATRLAFMCSSRR